MLSRLIPATLVAALSIIPAMAQETRGAIFGRVSDPQNSVIPGAALEVTNTDTNTVMPVTTNETGYFEANLLIAGNYRITAEKAGFRRVVRSGIVVPMGTRVEISLTLEIGDVNQTVEVTAEAPLVDTSASTSAGRVMATREVLDLPTFNNSPLMLIKLAPGIQASNNRRYNGVNALGGTGEAHNIGNVGGNDWSIDGGPNMGTGYQAASLPYSTTIAEYRVATQDFDSSVGHSSGAAISIMTKAGANAFHGDVTEQYWNSRWNGALFVVRQSYYRSIAAAEAAGNHALAESIRSRPVNPPGHSNTYAGSIGGPVILPKLINGRNKLFFFFNFNGFKDNKITESNVNHNVPTMAERSGDMSDLLAVSSAKYQLFDPLSVRPDPSRSGHFLRDPIAGNLIPGSRMINPTAKTYLGFEPVPNNPPSSANLEPLNNYVGATEPRNWAYWALSNRIDYQISDKHRFFGRWSYLNYREDTLDWTYQSKRGLMTYGWNRNNLGVTANWVSTPGPTTVVDVALAVNNYSEGNILSAVALGYTPSSVGLPAYLDAKAGANHSVPVMTWSDYSGTKAYETLGQSMPGWNRYEDFSIRSNLTRVLGDHTLRSGVDAREQRRAGGDPGRTGGAYDYKTGYTCQQDDCLTAGTLGHSWAAYLMGLPSTSVIDTNDTYYVGNPYVGWYAQDSWRASKKLSLNIGGRLEYEFGFNERYNRFIGGFDPTAALPITALAQAAYAQSPIPELSASAFSVLGGTFYPGSGSAGRRFPAGQLMFLPRIGFAYALSPSTALRGGYGVYHDTLNPHNRIPDQTGFSQATTNSSSTDYGQTWFSGNPLSAISPLTDPFPVRADGTRYDPPLGAAYGLLAVSGNGGTFLDPNFKRAKQQRWRLDFQRQLVGGMVLSVSYSGMYSGDVRLTRKLDSLPSQYWNVTSTRNNTIATNLNSNVTNPFYIANFASLQTSNSTLYRAMASRAFFTSKTIRKNQLLRPYPQMNGLSVIGGFGAAKSHAADVVVRRSFSKGFMFDFTFSRLYERDRDFYNNEFDPEPSWELSNNGVPWRFSATGIWQLPFGQNKWLARGRIGSAVLGGWQISAVYENQPGPLLTWNNVFYNGDPNKICDGWSQTYGQWFNTSGFVTDATQQPAAFQARVFPRRIGNCRADGLNRLDTNIQRTFRIREGLTFQMRLDALNVVNKSQMSAPDIAPNSSTFGKVTSNTTSTNRFLLIQGRISF
jgi:hypothetical protein